MDVPTIKLRDKRKPGHCWQDNELYDCFQPVIGPLAVGVYARLTRECYGTTVKISLRELAELTGISKSAVGRAMAVLEKVGMVMAKRAAVKRAPEYDLADLKELAASYGGLFDRKRCSYVLPASVCQLLRLEIAQLEKRMHGSGVPPGDTEEKLPGDTAVPAEGHDCPPNAEKMAGATYSKKEESKNPPIAPAGGSKVADVATGDPGWKPIPRRFLRKWARDGPVDVAFVHHGPELDEETIRELRQRADERERKAAMGAR